MDALTKLLIEKYGIPQNQAEAYAQDIIAGNRGTSARGVTNGTHEDALQGEALTRVGEDALMEYMRLGNFGYTAAAGGHNLNPQLEADYRARMAASADKTRANAARASDERDLLSRRQDEAQGIVDGEIFRLADMLARSKVVPPEPLSIGPVTAVPKPTVAIDVGGSRPAMPHDAAVSPMANREARGRGTLQDVEVPDPYAERLKRATQARQAMLGN